MHVIKHIPEDFVVNEISNVALQEKGDYALFELRKRNYGTPEAVQRIAEVLRRYPKDFGFAGNKDRKAVTTQLISLFKGTRQDMDLDILDIDLEFKGFSHKKIALGELEGNAFTIVVRNLEDVDVQKAKGFVTSPRPVPNYFGSQRFSSANHLIGRELVKKRFSHAIELVKEHDKAYQNSIAAFLKNNPQNAIGALRLIPHHTLRMYLHAYQSFLFNSLLKKALKENAASNSSFPVIGFGTEPEKYKLALRTIIETILKKENISPRDFINRQMPEVSSEGGTREAFFMPKNFAILEEAQDDAFEGRKKVKLSFELRKGCYATTLLSFVFNDCSDLLNDLL
jgi:tRNA pseudouridine13 synthase